MEKNKIKFKAFECEPLSISRTFIKLPKALDINEISIIGFTHDCDTLLIDDSGTLSIEVVEYVEKNIRDNFKDVKEINEKIKGDNSIVIEYLGATGTTVRREVYEGITYIGERYNGANFNDTAALLATTLVFRYKTRRNATAC